MPTRVLTINALRRELRKSERVLAKLQLKRSAALRRLQKIDSQILAIGGRAFAGAKTVAAKSARTGGFRRARKRATGKPLAAYIKDVLKGVPNGMRVKDIMTAVQKAGYRSTSRDFYGIVSATVRDAKLKRVGRGIYKLA